MTSTIVDSNVLLDLISQAGSWRAWSQGQVRRLSGAGKLLINCVIYAEASAEFDSRRAFEQTFPSDRFLYEPLPQDAAQLAGRTHLDYRRSGGGRERTLPDFLIGAHAQVKGYRLLTRDARRYRTYFPALDIVAPDSHP